MTALPEQPLSPLDGRYRSAVSGLSEQLSEAALNRARVHVEVEWLLYLTGHSLFGSSPLPQDKVRALKALVSDFGQDDITQLAALEATTRHDVKAVEYFVRGKLAELNLEGISELTHFGCTSEDINNLAYALTIGAAVREVWLPKLHRVIDALHERAITHRATAMLAHTHGQPATPTTVGKEFAVFVARLRRLAVQVEATDYWGKFSGATGTFAAQMAADPTQDWATISQEFVSSLGLTWNPLTTQIESHDWQAE
ncbi:MAG TPA: lyase family protein, partial [Terrimesophilobacter sp.]|nr:lyase family protein [Terrimesophilobacter sp.]